MADDAARVALKLMNWLKEMHAAGATSYQRVGLTTGCGNDIWGWKIAAKRGEAVIDSFHGGDLDIEAEVLGHLGQLDIDLAAFAAHVGTPITVETVFVGEGW